MKKTVVQEIIERLNESDPKMKFLLWIMDSEVQKSLLKKDEDLISDAFDKGCIEEGFLSGTAYFENNYKINKNDKR
jgi:hypothetical protein